MIQLHAHPRVPVGRRPRGAVAAALVGVALAVGAPAGAIGAPVASLTLPDPGQLVGALGTLAPSASAGVLASALTRIQSAPSTVNIAAFDAAVNAITGAHTITLPGSRTPAGVALESAAAGVGALAPAGASAAQGQTVGELRGALINAGLPALLSGASSGPSTVVGQLAALAKLTPGAPTVAGGLSSVGATVSTLATAAGSSSPDGATLSAVAGSLDAATGLSPSQLQTVITQLGTVTSAAASGTTGVSVTQLCTALAGAMAESGSLLGPLAGVDSDFSAIHDPADLAGALGELDGLAAQAPGTALPLGSVAQALAAVAATPGVPTGPASTLAATAQSLAASPAASASTLLDALSSISSVGPQLPAQLSGVVGELTSVLSGSGSVFGTVAGLSSATAAQALGDLNALSTLSSGADTPALPGLAGVLDQIAAAIPSADPLDLAALHDLTATISTTALDPDQFAGAAEAISDIAHTLPSPQSATITAVANDLGADARAVGGVANLTVTPVVVPVHVPATTFTILGAPTHLSTGVRPSALRELRVGRVTRHGDRVTLSLDCVTHAHHGCRVTVRATLAGAPASTRRLTIGPGHRVRVALRCAPARRRHAQRGPELDTPTVRLTLTISGAGGRVLRAIA